MKSGGTNNVILSALLSTPPFSSSPPTSLSSSPPLSSSITSLSQLSLTSSTASLSSSSSTTTISSSPPLTPSLKSTGLNVKLPQLNKTHSKKSSLNKLKNNIIKKLIQNVPPYKDRNNNMKNDNINKEQDNFITSKKSFDSETKFTVNNSLINTKNTVNQKNIYVDKVDFNEKIYTEINVIKPLIKEMNKIEVSNCKQDFVEEAGSLKSLLINQTNHSMFNSQIKVGKCGKDTDDFKGLWEGSLICEESFENNGGDMRGMLGGIEQGEKLVNVSSTNDNINDVNICVIVANKDIINDSKFHSSNLDYSHTRIASSTQPLSSTAASEVTKSPKSSGIKEEKSFLIQDDPISGRFQKKPFEISPQQNLSNKLQHQEEKQRPQLLQVQELQKRNLKSSQQTWTDPTQQFTQDNFKLSNFPQNNKHNNHNNHKYPFNTFQPNTSGHSLQPSKKKRRRVITTDQRRAANIRERRRMCHLNDAFDGLRKRVPTFAYEKKLSRIETLKIAVTYIRFMAELLGSFVSSDEARYIDRIGQISSLPHTATNIYPNNNAIPHPHINPIFHSYCNSVELNLQQQHNIGNYIKNDDDDDDDGDDDDTSMNHESPSKFIKYK